MKYLPLFLALLTSLAAVTSIPDQNTLTIETPAFKERKVTKLQLDNGLQVLIVSDPLLDKSGAVLAVGSGSLAEPQTTPGLAHFLEHMLFMGTEKYPDENQYWDIITSNGGQTNAFTDNDRTAYMFSISNDAFLSVLDRFAQFFISPLFSPSGISREMHAVDQEYRRYVTSDDWRVMGLIQALSNPDSTLSRFTVGNLTTLAGVTQEQLKEWWKEYYSANRMRLVIYSPLPLDVLEKAVIDDFSAIASHPITEPTVLPAFLPTYEGKKITVQSIQDARTLYIAFDLDKTSYNQLLLLEEALTDQSPQSLIRGLQEKGLASGISTVDGKAYNRLQLLVMIDLTEKGQQQYEEVLKDFYGTLNYFKETGIPKAYFDQWQEAAKLRYSYQSPQDLFKKVMNEGMVILDEEMATYPMNTTLLTDYNPEKMRALLETLTADHSYIFLLTPDKIEGETEQWFGAQYQVSDLPEDLLSTLALSQTEVTLPTTNPYLPSSLALVDCSMNSLVPQRLKSEAPFYWLCDNQFNLPKTTAILHIKPSKSGSLGVKSAVLRDFIVAATIYKLQPALFQASQAGLDISFEEKEGAFLLKATAFSESLPACLTTIAETFTNLSLSPLEFESIKSTLLQNYLRAVADEPFKQGLDLTKQLLSQAAVPYDKKAKVLQKLTLELFEKASLKLRKEVLVEGLIFGNTTEEEATSLATKFPSTSVTDLYTPAYFQETTGPILLEKEISQLGNFAGLIIEDGCFSLEKEAALAILTTGLNEPFFTELRTKQQTGYIVKNLSPSHLGTLTEIFIVQSTTYDPRELLSRFELFLEQVTIDEDRFNALKKSYLEDLKAPEKSPLDVAEKFDKMAFRLQGDFEWYNKRIAATEKLTYATFKDFYQGFLSRSNKQRIALLLKGQQQGERALRYKAVSNLAELQKTGQYVTFDQNQCK